ncbi:hypothetical protein BDW59DRAFT_143678 [Aspergillus cavernicola]|uniref:Uncharacterized protein n=1 Tax=Aspergillus cavernicola TaxID=176166 RepID=A0ABR4IJV3_9EURO
MNAMKLVLLLPNAPAPPPPSVPISGDDSAIAWYMMLGVWSLGNYAFCKVKLCIQKHNTRVCDYVHKQQPKFRLPDILYQAESNGRTYLFLSRVPGRTLALDEE